MGRFSEWIGPLVLVTTAYIVCFYLTYVVIFPIQAALFGSIPLYASLLYLPHGVRVLTARFYGWKSLLFLTPATLHTHYYLNGIAGNPEINLLPILASIFCAPLSFWIYGKMYRGRIDRENLFLDWRSLLVVGVLASVINALALDLYHFELSPMEMSRVILAYLIGDLSGLFVLMYLLMLSFRWARNF